MKQDHSTWTTRRQFMLAASAAAGAKALAVTEAVAVPLPQQQPDPAAPPVKPERINRHTIAEAEKLAAVEYTNAEREQMLGTITGQVESFAKRMNAEPLPNELAPATIFDPLQVEFVMPERAEIVMTPADPGPLPASDEDIAFAPVMHLSHWIHTRQITSRRLTEIYLERLKRIGPKLECVVTITEDKALQLADRADQELARGGDHGPLHGVPWGAKDLFDTAGIPTTWGAMPFRERVPSEDAVVVQMLEDAGAVLVAKLTLGALAYGDIWFGGRTRSPWNLNEGSSGSSAGSAAATAAGLVGFALGTETYGSIVSPCMACGATGLRPTFGRVPRTGAMALSWSLDKIGPICRTAEDTILVLDAIRGADVGDPSSIDLPLAFDASASLRGVRVGYDPAWFTGNGAHGAERGVIDLLRDLDVNLVRVSLPEWPYEILENILLVEAASAFEELTLTGGDDLLVWQESNAWPNTFRQARFIPGIELIQADRFRRRVMEMMAEVYHDVDVLLSPSFAGQLLLITNFTGHPALTLRTGFNDDDGMPRGITLWGSLFDEGTLVRLGMSLEQAFGVWHVRPHLE